MLTVVSFALRRNFASLNCVCLPCGSCSAQRYYHLSLKACQSRELSNRIINRRIEGPTIHGKGGFISRLIVAINRRGGVFFFFSPLFSRSRCDERTDERPTEWTRACEENQYSCVRDKRVLRRPTGGHRPEDCIAEAHFARFVGIVENSHENFRPMIKAKIQITSFA